MPVNVTEETDADLMYDLCLSYLKIGHVGGTPLHAVSTSKQYPNYCFTSTACDDECQACRSKKLSGAKPYQPQSLDGKKIYIYHYKHSFSRKNYPCLGSPFPYVYVAGSLLYVSCRSFGKSSYDSDPCGFIPDCIYCPFFETLLYASSGSDSCKSDVSCSWDYAEQSSGSSRLCGILSGAFKCRQCVGWSGSFPHMVFTFLGHRTKMV